MPVAASNAYFRGVPPKESGIALAIDWSPDGDKIAAATSGGAVCVWKVPTTNDERVKGRLSPKPALPHVIVGDVGRPQRCVSWVPDSEQTGGDDARSAFARRVDRALHGDPRGVHPGRPVQAGGGRAWFGVQRARRAARYGLAALRRRRGDVLGGGFRSAPRLFRQISRVQPRRGQRRDRQLEGHRVGGPGRRRTQGEIAGEGDGAERAGRVVRRR